MPRFKPDSSFFKKIVIGANGVKAICSDLAQYGHEIVELERGAAGTKLWKGVKRKRVRLPDLVCKLCGQRVESRSKTKPELSMSHSDTEQERSWDYGMLSEDWIAFPISVPLDEELWTRGTFQNRASYWHERNWIKWLAEGRINYFTVDSFRQNPADTRTRKGVTEGSELTLSWKTKFATCSGVIDRVESNRIRIQPQNGRVRTLRLTSNLPVYVEAGEDVEKYQVLASAPEPLTVQQLRCSQALGESFIQNCLSSRERTVRFTGIKLSRIRGEEEYASVIEEMANDTQEDLYVRLESLSYLASIGERQIYQLFEDYLNNSDEQIRLESVITIGETGISDAVQLLGVILHDQNHPYYLRSAAAWSLGNIGSTEAQEQLKSAFADVNWDIREEALEALTSLGQTAYSILLPGLQENNQEIAGGCAEAIRQIGIATPNLITELRTHLNGQTPPKWVVWLAGSLTSREITETIDKIEDIDPRVHYAISLMWSFTRSWISRRWELQSGANDSGDES